MPDARSMPARDPAVLRIAVLALATALVAALALGLGAGGWDWPLIVTLRAPRVAAAAGVGGLLALAGLALQVLLRNPLADPYVLGHSGGASVGALAALLSRSRLLVCNDTGTSHLACALEVPSVVVFRNTDMERWAPRNRDRHRSVWDPQGERVDEVLSEARSLLDLRR